MESNVLFSSAHGDGAPLTSEELLEVGAALLSILDRWEANGAATIGAQGALAAAAHKFSVLLQEREPAPSLDALDLAGLSDLGDLSDLDALNLDDLDDADDHQGGLGLGRLDLS